MVKGSIGLLLLTAPLLGACATVPLGPSVMVLPGTGKPFEQFQADDASCRQWAFHQVGVVPSDAAGTNAVGGATLGTILGAGLGAAIGAAAGNPGIGAAVGAGSGLLFGTAAGASAGQYSGLAVQQRYDIAYQQCMYAKGNQVPAAAHSPRRVEAPPPPPPPPPPPVNPAPPPPPPGPPPPPPPR